MSDFALGVVIGWGVTACAVFVWLALMSKGSAE